MYVRDGVQLPPLATRGVDSEGTGLVGAWMCSLAPLLGKPLRAGVPTFAT